MYDTLVSWLLHCDRQAQINRDADRVLVPLPHLKLAIQQAARDEGREAERFPWETQAVHTERVKTLTHTRKD